MERSPIHFLALGDSLTVGVGGIRKGGFIKEYQRLSEIALQRRVIAQKLAKSKITSAELLHFLASPYVQNAIFHANIITISIGGNDLIQANRHFSRTNNQEVFRYALHSLKVNLQSILKTITSIKRSSNEPYMIRVIGLYNPYPELPYSHYWVNNFNDQMSAVSNMYGQFINLDPIFLRFKDSILSFDSLHPNSKGYQIIATELYRSGYQELFYSRELRHQSKISN